MKDNNIVKRVNGHVIKRLTRDELNKDLLAAGDWGIEYYVPGRVLKCYYIILNRKRHKYSDLEYLEKICAKYTKKELENMSAYELFTLKV